MNRSRILSCILCLALCAQALAQTKDLDSQLEVLAQKLGVVVPKTDTVELTAKVTFKPRAARKPRERQKPTEVGEGRLPSTMS